MQARRVEGAPHFARGARGARAVVAIAGVLAFQAPLAHAQDPPQAQRVPAEARLVVPIEESGAAALGRGWNDAHRRFVSQRGTCIAFDASSLETDERVYASLETLSRAGGHLRIGLHVAVHRGIESIEGARLVDAARRLARQDLASFQAHCGDAFVAGTVAGTQLIGEFDIDSRDGGAAHSWLQRRGLFGPADDLEELAESLGAFVQRFSVHAQVLAGGRRSSATPMEPDALIAAAAAFPVTSEGLAARPYLALLVDYPEYMRSGLALDFLMQAPTAPGRAVFASMRPKRSAASEMHLARATRRPPPPAPVNLPVFRVERFPVRVIQTAAVGGGVVVYAGASAPPDHFVEDAGGTRFWIPGAAAGTPRVRSAIADAMVAMAPGAERWPLRWVRRYAAGQVDGAAVYLSPDAPIPGTHSGRNPVGYVWIPGVSTPSPRERKLVDDVLRAAAPPVSSAP